MGATVSVAVNGDGLNFPRPEYSFTVTAITHPAGLNCYSYEYPEAPSFEMSNSGFGECRGSWAVEVTHIPTGETKNASIQVIAKSTQIE